MRRNAKNKITITVHQPNDRILSTYQSTKKETPTTSAFSLRSSNYNSGPREFKINTNKKYLICNTSPNTKISKHLNLTRTIQSIPRSSHSKEGIVSNKFINKNNILSGVRTNTNNRIHNTNHNTSTISTYTNRSQTIHYPLTENAQRGKYQRISITNNFNNNNKNYFYANLNNVRISHRPYGIIQAYATITSSGKRNYNEDRVSIIYNIPKPPGYSQAKNNNIPWPNCSFFGLYDGHGGSRACDFLRDNLHKYIINDKYFPSNPQKAIANGFIYAEKLFFKNYTGIDSSGSCAIIILIIENRCYIANVGDSRAIISAKNGTKFYPLSRDHRPGDEKEYKRILDAGGKIYKTEYEYGNRNSATNNRNSTYTRNTNYTRNYTNNTSNRININSNRNSSVVGPLRVSPGKLSVSRTIGDIEAKDPKFGGNPNVIISIPEIKYFDNNDKNDFILIFCDGVYEKLKNQDIIDCIWDQIRNKKFSDIHNMAGYSIEKLINKCMQQDSTDNLTAIMICLKNYEKLKTIETPVPHTANIDLAKTKKLNITANIRKRSQSKKPLSMLLTKLIHNNSQNVKKVINLKNNKENKDTRDYSQYMRKK
jgi:protein phosphatase 2C family protein 2/3